MFTAIDLKILFVWSFLLVSHELCYACQRIFAIFFIRFIVRYFSGFLVYNIARKSHLHFTFDYMMGWRLFKSINLLLYGICHQWHAYHQTSLLCLGMLFPYQDYLLMLIFVVLFLYAYCVSHLKCINCKTTKTLHASNKAIQAEQNIAIIQLYDLLLIIDLQV